MHCHCPGCTARTKPAAMERAVARPSPRIHELTAPGWQATAAVAGSPGCGRVVGRRPVRLDGPARAGAAVSCFNGGRSWIFNQFPRPSCKPSKGAATPGPRPSGPAWLSLEQSPEPSWPAQLVGLSGVLLPGCASVGAQAWWQALPSIPVPMNRRRRRRRSNPSAPSAVAPDVRRGQPAAPLRCRASASGVRSRRSVPASALRSKGHVR
jgi:hypothetical protein